MNTVTKVLTGDLESTRTTTVSIGNLSFSASAYTLADLAQADYGKGRRTPAEYRYLHWCVYNGTSAANGGEHDWLLISRYK
jgi:hypothetical protein